MSPWVIASIAGFGALGALARYAVLSGARTPTQSTIALAVVNLGGSLVAGILAALPGIGLDSGLVVGLCGAFTTFSALAAQLAPEGRPRPIPQLVGLSLLHGLGSLLAAWTAWSIVAAVVSTATG